MTATLAAFYKRPDGDDEALATFWRRYRDEHMPLIEKLPGLRGTRIWNVSRKYAGEDLVAVCFMDFDNAETLKAAMKSEEMAAAGKNLSEITSEGMLTLVALEESWE